MTNDKLLPKETQKQVCEESAQYLKKLIADKRDPCCYAVTDYIAGATAWAPWKVRFDELQAQAQRMAGALEEIAQSNCDYESTNYAKALHMPNCRACKAKEALQQFKDGKEVGEEPKPEGWPWICEHCGKQDCESDHK